MEMNDYENYEVIVVDGGSTDKTRDIAKRYGAKVIEGPQKGTAVARNLGWRNAEGEAIIFLDADWFLDAEALKAVAKEFKSGADIVTLQNKHYTTNWVSKAVSAENNFGNGSQRAESIKKLFQKIEEGVSWL